MRDYKKKMDELKAGRSADRQRYLSAYCHTTNEERLQVVSDVMAEEFGDDQIARWIYLGVVKGYKWARLEASHIPCSMDIYRVYRARFYRALHIKLGGDHVLKVPPRRRKDGK